MTRRYRVEPSYTVAEHLVRAGALVVGYVLAALIVLAVVMAACSAVAIRHEDAPHSAAPSAGDTWGLPIEEPTRTAAPRPSWLVTLPSGAPAGLDIEDLCAQLANPGEVPECADLGY